MTKTIVKKIVLLVFVVVSLFLFINSVGLSKIGAYDVQMFSPWKGNDLDFSHLEDIPFESSYQPFKTIIESTQEVNMNHYYVIEDAYDLYKLSELSLGEDKITYLSLNYVLGNNIDYYDTVLENINHRFHPIGFIEPFVGTFDGQGFEISNLYFQTILDEETYNNQYSGLRFFSMFSKVGIQGTIKNLGLINPIIIQPIEWGIMDHASALVGENYGHIENVYLIDTRMETAGFHVEGAFHVSGMISINQGTVSNAFIATPYVKSNAVVNLQSINVFMHQNYGIVTQSYYDQSIYGDINGLTNHVVGLSTEDFQDDAYFSNAWYFNDHYLGLTLQVYEESQASLNHTYPILQGLSYDQGVLQISNAIEFNYMNKLLVLSGFFRSRHYQVVKDIDMNQIARGAYRGASVGFNGEFSSALRTPQSSLYERSIDQGGDLNYHTVIGLKICHASEVGNFSSYAMFASLFGIVRNVNFVRFEITTNDLQTHTNKTKILIGTIAGQMNNGRIENVHILGDIDIISIQTSTTRIYAGGVIGEGSGTIKNVSTKGTITHGVQIYASKNNESSTAGIIAKSNGITIENLINSFDVMGMSYSNHVSSKHYVSGVIGYGKVNSLTKVVNLGHIKSHDVLGYMDTLYISGIIGLQMSQNNEIEKVYNQGSITTYMTNPMTLSLSGFGSVDGSLDASESTYLYRSLTNNGIISLNHPNGNQFTELELSEMDIKISSLIIADAVDASFYGLFNERSISLDLSLIDAYSSNLIISNSNKSSITQSYNTGNITLTSENTIVKENIRVSGNILGSNISMTHLRNEGNINVSFNNASLNNNGQLYVFGLFEDVSQDMTANDGFNGGDITISKAPSVDVYHDIWVSGIGYKHSNTNYMDEHHIDPTSIQITDITGSMNHFINDGDLSIVGDYHSSTRASGILLHNYGLLTKAINLGSIQNKNNLQVLNHEVESSGIVYMMIGAYAQVKDSANYGDIVSVSTTDQGYTSASGIVGRNDRLENLSYTTQGTNHKYAKILFSINYGDVYAYSGVDESTYTITNETRSKASGIFGQGLLSIVNVINYGDTFSKYLAAGIFGFVDFPKFGEIAKTQVYLANAINYGKVRAITSYDGTFNIDMTSYPMRTSYNAFSSFIGKYHTGTSSWEFLSVSSSALYPIDNINFGYIVNFDDLGNMLGNAPQFTLADNLADNGIGNSDLLAIINKFSTTNDTDSSKEPFKLFYVGTHPKGSNYGKAIHSYLLDETSFGIFNTNFILKTPPVSFTGTDQYLRNYISYVPIDKANSVLIDQLESNTTQEYMGLYVLTSSRGVANGIYMPDHMDLEALHPYYGEIEDTTWLGDTSDTNSVIYKLTHGMRQIQVSYATTIYDLEIMQVDESGNPIQNGLSLQKPIIDEQRGLITYYLPSNAQILNHLTSQTKSTYSFVEASQGMEGVRKVPYVYDEASQTWSYKYVGDYQKVGYYYEEIGPYHSTGTVNLTFSVDPILIESKNSENYVTNATYTYQTQEAESILNQVFKHLPHYQRYVSHNFWWTQTGHTVTGISTVLGSYGAYKRVVEPYPASIYGDGVYEYVGPHEAIVTYMRSESETMTIFEDAGVYFKASTATGSYVIADGASLLNNGMPQLELITIPKSFGAYDVIHDSTNDDLIDSLESHYGKVRIYSSNYESADPQTYRDYDIRIIRTADQSLIDIESLHVNGIDAIPTVTDFRDITSTVDINFISDGSNGVLSVRYQTMNMATGYNILSLVSLYDEITSNMIESDLYLLHKGVVENTNVFNNLTGVWGNGYVTYDFEVTDLLPSGSYRLELELVTGEVATIFFEKIESSNGFIVEFNYQNEVIHPDGLIEISMIPYGIFYDVSDARTEIVNFSNLSSLSNIDYLDIENNIPSYLNHLVISPFSTLISIDLSIAQIGGYKYQYDILYTIEAEDGTLSGFTHRLLEYDINPNPIYIYNNGGEVDLPFDELVIGYMDAPTVRVEFNLTNVYLPDTQTLNVSSSMTPTDQTIGYPDVDFFITYLGGIGYSVDFNQNMPLGYYEFNYVYTSEVSLWGELLLWTFEFEEVTVLKVKNSDSLLKNILFVSDSIFTGFNTIVDIAEMTVETYVGYLENPETRKMTVLPTKGIYYGDYDHYPIYWIVGQVQKTNLTVYQPSFELPNGAVIRKVVDFMNVGIEYQSEELTADFSPVGDMLNYILYRVYAHDFDDYPTHYTDYYVAVQDITNNIRFNLTVENDTNYPFSEIYIKVNVCQVEVGYTGICSQKDRILGMGVFSHYNQSTEQFENNQFQTTMYGTYVIEAVLPKGFTFTLRVQDVEVPGRSFYLEDSLLPRKYYITLTIIEDGTPIQWGQEEIIDYVPNSN
ncbi:hypothetical protein [Peloplasma aerotolerans]|uniref:Uncharacterized protein n=1 Tax=Peloplasma aerotolerans TaxID=3044389 RepID=A0AAW6U3H9_9MOLU|nr:hypothetical protein [Mariniplasma sp. M4Ah]MDI6452462.1 hypothetical protein [Mariniplasma sp. M4Ah]